PDAVVQAGISQLQVALVKHRLAIQPMRHTTTWYTLCDTVVKSYGGDLRSLFVRQQWDIPRILQRIQSEEKTGFPYLCGTKICHYWLYVVSRYTDAKFRNLGALNIAPDTHIIQASIRLGLVNPEQRRHHSIQRIVLEAWERVLEGTGIQMIELHTPLW